MQVQTTHVAVVGVGLVGSELISQLLSLPSPSPFRLVSLSSSKHTLFSPDGITSQSWKSDLASSPTPAEIPTLLQSLSDLVKQRKRVVLVDNTSDEGVANSYPDFLKYGISVVTPNKKAYSGDLGLYNRIMVESVASGSSWLNESTVGAGLPIISTLKDLVATGDKVNRVILIYTTFADT
jgi:homoserine dehydrogenase